MLFDASQVVQLLFLLVIGTVVYPVVEYHLAEVIRTYVLYNNVVVRK